MRWSAREKLKIALPYALFRWRDRGYLIEALVNCGYWPPSKGPPPSGIPPKDLAPAERFYGPHAPINDFPYDSGPAAAAARRRLRAVLLDWGIDPDERLLEVTLDQRWAARLERSEG
jgi:hypothetical protein